jgi:hypothetical protein
MSCGYTAMQATASAANKDHPANSIIVDAAFGVGSLSLDAFLKYQTENRCV